VTVVAGASGTRIDCDICGEYTSSPDLTPDQLRRATGYARVTGRDLCPDCAAVGHDGELRDRPPRIVERPPPDRRGPVWRTAPSRISHENPPEVAGQSEAIRAILDVDWRRQARPPSAHRWVADCPDESFAGGQAGRGAASEARVGLV
jgi:hypothetical protein